MDRGLGDTTLSAVYIEDMDGTRVELLARVGRSGSAELFRARLHGPAGFSRPALVKRLPAAQAHDRRHVERLRTDALLSAHVHHANVMPVLGLVQLERGELGVAWADARVTDLQRVLEICATQRKRIAPHVVLGIGWHIAGALAAAHERADERLGLSGIAHGELSPSNVLIDERGHLLLVDFGIGIPSGAAASGGMAMVRLGRLHGKPGYMSPELVVRGVIGPRSDLFTLGTLLWEMSTLKRLFAGKDAAETLKNVAVAQVDERFARHPELPPFVQDVLRRCLRRAPEERWASARELQDALVAAYPQGFFGIEDELARIVAELAPIPPDAPLELEAEAATARPRARSRLTPRMILPVHADVELVYAAEGDEDAWSEAETPEILDVLEDAPDVAPLELASVGARGEGLAAAVVAPPPLPDEPGAG
ncbi:MAG: serine/threonine protein kinase [Deltaproteobacteria bacterium]|nr:serine/threonine protein kinase [Deltaproteobacteria bacterium]